MSTLYEGYVMKFKLTAYKLKFEVKIFGSPVSFYLCLNAYVLGNI